MEVVWLIYLAFKLISLFLNLISITGEKFGIHLFTNLWIEYKQLTVVATNLTSKMNQKQYLI